MHAVARENYKKIFGYGSQMTSQESNLMRIHDSLCGRAYLFYGFLTTL